MWSTVFPPKTQIGKRIIKNINLIKTLFFCIFYCFISHLVFISPFLSHLLMHVDECFHIGLHRNGVLINKTKSWEKLANSLVICYSSLCCQGRLIVFEPVRPCCTWSCLGFSLFGCYGTTSEGLWKREKENKIVNSQYFVYPYIVN